MIKGYGLVTVPYFEKITFMVELQNRKISTANLQLISRFCNAARGTFSTIFAHKRFRAFNVTTFQSLRLFAI